jgi:chromosome partitioning protein
MRVLVVANHKGGVGKTALAACLLQEAALRGPVLGVDLDPQGNLTDALRPEPGGGTLAEALQYPAGNALRALRACPVPAGADRLRLLPSSPALSREAFRRESLGEVLSRIPGFPLVVVDLPPSLSLWTQAALLAATDLLIPIAPSRYALAGAEAIRSAAVAIRPAVGERVRAVVTLFDGRIGSHVRCEAEARRLFPVAATLPRVSRIPDNLSEGRPWSRDVARAPRERYAAALAAILDSLEGAG